MIWMKAKLSSDSGGYMWLISAVIFAVVAASMLFSTCYMNLSVRAEEEAHYSRAVYKQLGENLAEASDYLTAEVRYYAVTGDIAHLYNYWEEIFVTKRREQAVEAFESSNPPKEEKELLEQAKKYSDILVETETRSMKLVLTAEGKTAADYADEEKLYNYVAHVLAYEDSDLHENIAANIDKQSLRLEAVEILYDKNYEAYKTEIMSPIEKFNTLMNARLDKEVEERKRGTQIATIMQIILAMAALCAIGFLLQLMKKMYSIRQEKKEAELASQAKSTFLAHMSHELRTPLNAVSGYVYLLEQTAPDKKQREYLKGIRYSSEGLLELINQILDFSKMESGKLELEEASFSLCRVVREVEAVFAGEAVQRNLFFTVEMEEGVPDNIFGDSLRLRQVLLNLLGNAFKFTKEGEISLLVRLKEKKKEKYILYFEVKDSGIGIAETAKEKIFMPFVQSDASITRKYGGTGLGLSICSEIIRLAGDKTHRLEVKSKMGKGSTFHFTMDFLQGNTGCAAEPEKEVQIPYFSAQKVLLVDDSEINIKVQKEILSLCGLQVLTAMGGRQAIEILEKEREIALIFMDIRMPEMDGFEAARRIRRLEGYGEVPIIALTADTIPQEQRILTETGISGCLLKPVKQEALFQLLKSYFAEKKPLEKSIKKSVGRASTEMVECFLMLHKNDKDLLQEMLAKGEWKKAEELVHQLKGITGNLGCSSLYESCRRLQEELQKNRADSFPVFVECWENTIKVFEAEKEKKQPPKAAEDNDIEADKFSEIFNLSSGCDTAAVSFLEERWQKITVWLKREEEEGLKKAMLSYDFEKMEEYIHKVSDRKRRREEGRCTE